MSKAKPPPIDWPAMLRKLADEYERLASSERKYRAIVDTMIRCDKCKGWFEAGHVCPQNG